MILMYRLTIEHSSLLHPPHYTNIFRYNFNIKTVISSALIDMHHQKRSVWTHDLPNCTVRTNC